MSAYISYVLLPLGDMDETRFLNSPHQKLLLQFPYEQWLFPFDFLLGTGTKAEIISAFVPVPKRKNMHYR